MRLQDKLTDSVSEQSVLLNDYFGVARAVPKKNSIPHDAPRVSPFHLDALNRYATGHVAQLRSQVRHDVFTMAVGPSKE